MQAAVIREKFLRFFEAQGHQVVPSSPIVPAGDPTLLFTAAGMVQFKDVFLGVDKRSYSRAATVQKCMRAGGKHNDLDQVGRTERHQTFFEMLGNFSFGDYFKRDAIRYAWMFLTEELHIDAKNLWITVYETDDEAFLLWQEVAGVSPDRIVRMGEDNFWAMGDTGPCGPSSEIFVDRGEQFTCGSQCGLGHCDCDRFREVWNLVFMQYERNAGGELTPLPRPSIDTGMGLERIVAYLQGVESTFDTDLLFPLITAVERMSGQSYDRGIKGMPFRVIADHVRAMTFLLAEGVSFSNEGRGYVMRRILRRAMRYGMQLGFNEPFLYRLVPEVVTVMGEAYPELVHGESLIVDFIRQEEERFRVTLNSGMKVLDQKLEGLPVGAVLPGGDAFQLYDTYGFPLDLTRDAALERGITVDEQTFEGLMREQRERARKNRTKTVEQLPIVEASEFVGYTNLVRESEPLRALYVERDRIERLQVGESGWINVSKTPFYPEGGGQVGDRGTLVTPTGTVSIDDTIKVSGAIWHLGRVTSGVVSSGQPGNWTVDSERRYAAMRNHTGTHLLHAALREVLGGGVHQTGSLVSPDRLRFDFSYNKPLTVAEVIAIEDLVNGWILDDIDVNITFSSKDAALAEGALAFFDDKYGETVRVITIPGASQELCGGTHCARTGQIGLFAIREESSIGGGSRRIEAVTGWNALQLFREQRTMVQALQPFFAGLDVHAWPERVQGWLSELKRQQHAQEELGRVERSQRGQQLAQSARQVGHLKFVVAEVDAASPEDLRDVLDGVKTEVDGAILAARHGEMASVVVFLGDKVRSRGFAAKLIVQPLSRVIGGGGGGRDDLAQAGGRAPDGVPQLLRDALEWVDKNFGEAG